MKKQKGYIRGYKRTSKAHYAKALNNQNIEVSFGMYHPDKGVSGEMTMEWFMIGNTLVPQLRCFDDGWNALCLFADLIEKMGKLDSQNIQEPEFCKLLDSCGFADSTEYENPNSIEKRTVIIELTREKAIKLGLING